MAVIYICAVILVCLNLGNSLGFIETPSPSEERYHFFDAELLQVFNEKEEANVLISPIGIKLVLGMLMEGAENATADEIRTALRLPEEKQARRKEFNNWLSMLQAKDSANTFKMANRLFLSDHYSVNQAYGRALTKYYSGGVTTVKFEEVNETSRVINNWVSDKTTRLIPTIVEEGQISPEDKLMLVSAVYFKGVWSTPFASERTATRCFYTKDNKCKDSLMMTETGYFDYGYISRLDAKAVVLPYKGGEFSMLLLLPTRRDGIKLLGRDMAHVSLSSILSELKEEEVLVQIPQFEVSYSDDLVESLKKVQVSDLFTTSANFSKMFTGDFETAYVSHVYHSAKITVNEEGSEAAAATGALFVPLMGGPITSFVANHPFLFFVINSAKNSVLFAGKVVHPQTPADSKKRLLSLTSHNSQIKKTSLEGNSVISQKNDTTHSSLEKTFHEMKPHRRGQQPGPKLRSIKPTLPRAPSKERVVADSPMHRITPGEFFEKDAYKKRGKTQDLPKNRKRQEQPVEEWRRHLLIFV